MKMTYAKLMKKDAEGDITIEAWTNDGEPVTALITIFKSDGTSRRATVEVTNCPADL